MASPLPSAPEPIIPTASNVGPEPHHPFSSQASLQASFLGLHDMTNALNLSLPPNTLRVLAQGHASGRLPMPPNYHAGQPSGTAELAAAGIPTTMEAHSQSTMLRPVSISAHSLGWWSLNPLHSCQRQPCISPHGERSPRVVPREKESLKPEPLFPEDRHTGATAHRVRQLRIKQQAQPRWYRLEMRRPHPWHLQVHPTWRSPPCSLSRGRRPRPRK